MLPAGSVLLRPFVSPPRGRLTDAALCPTILS
jgi:hypothetical protein